MNDYIFEILLRERRREMLEEAARLRLIRDSGLESRGWGQRCALACGDLLIRIGEGLKRWAQGKMAVAVESL